MDLKQHFMMTLHTEIQRERERQFRSQLTAHFQAIIKGEMFKITSKAKSHCSNIKKKLAMTGGFGGPHFKYQLGTRVSAYVYVCVFS